MDLDPKKPPEFDRERAKKRPSLALMPELSLAAWKVAIRHCSATHAIGQASAATPGASAQTTCIKSKKENG
jgi:hypothetical protein